MKIHFILALLTGIFAHQVLLFAADQTGERRFDPMEISIDRALYGSDNDPCDCYPANFPPTQIISVAKVDEAERPCVRKMEEGASKASMMLILENTDAPELEAVWKIRPNQIVNI